MEIETQVSKIKAAYLDLLRTHRNMTIRRYANCEVLNEKNNIIVQE